MENITFEKLPQAVKILINEVNELKKILLNQKQDTSQENQDELFTIQQTADFLNLTVPTIYSKVSRGDIPYMKQGKRLYFSKIELTEYIKQGRVKSNSQIDELAKNYINE